MVSKCHIEIRLLQGSRIDVAIEVDGEARKTWEAIEAPAHALDILREYLTGDDQHAVTVVLRTTDKLMQAWTTNSSSLALYWAAAALGNAWNDGTGSASQAPVSVSKESGPVRVKGATESNDPDDKERVA